jgi:2-succinyl-5-enolpyruvyl-6-hydroxy-3-cyclohexene-1-carboxylate synthase
VIVAGRIENEPRLAAAVSALAQRLEVPVLADPLSGARSGPTAIATYDLLLRDPELAAPLTPAQVIRIGDLPTSKPLRAWLAALNPGIRQVMLDPHGAWQDPDAVAAEIWTEDPVSALEALDAPERPGGSDWLEQWIEADAAAAAALRAGLGDELSEPLVAGRLGEWLGAHPARPLLFAAASMPIRDLEVYLPARVGLPQVLSNRGANGIDGTISAAFGAAASQPGRPVVLLIGDVALLHDLGGLVAARRLGLELTIVVINNDGGGIFHFLPVSGEGDAFERHVATPHGLSLQRVAALFDLGYERPATVSELERAVRGGIGRGAATLIEVRTDRADNLALHRRLADAAIAATRATGAA